jgi:predicted RNase H-like HicB family nuclease/DNA-binding XRE family transcriptional regulator
MRYHFRIHKENNGYWAESLEKGLGVSTQGDTLEELEKNIREALNLALNEPDDSRWIPPMPDESWQGKDVLSIAVEPRLALATMVRVTRLKQGLSQRSVAEKMGIKHIRQYQLLESGEANPELATLVKLKRTFPKLSLDAVLAP